jgi:hypothetical protein
MVPLVCACLLEVKLKLRPPEFPVAFSSTCHRSSNSRSLRLLILPDARILRAFVFL